MSGTEFFSYIGATPLGRSRARRGRYARSAFGHLNNQLAATDGAGQKGNMMGTMIAGNARPVVDFAKPLTAESCIALIDDIRRLRDDYFFDGVQLRLSSPGGEVTALEYYETAARGLRKEGFAIDTHAVTRVSSAAAIMLSMGDRRTAHPKAGLLYHTGRVAGVDGALTARAAASIADALGNVDGEIIGLLADRAARSPCPAGDTPRERFSVADWQAIVRLAPGTAKRPHTVLLRFRKRVAEAFDGGQEKLRDLYAEFCALDAPVSPYLAVELGLIDQVGDGEPEAAAQTDDPGLAIPQWEPLYPKGQVPRYALTRHTLILGESGSGKTVSGVLPVLSAIVQDASPVSSCLVVDPKFELYPAIKRMAGPGVQVRLLRPGVDSLDLMAGPRSVSDDIAAGRWMTAARKMLARASGFAPSGACVLAGKAASSPTLAFWEEEGAAYAQAALALSLLITQRGVWSGLMDTIPENSLYWHQLAAFGRRVGLIGSSREAPPINALAVAKCALDDLFDDEGAAQTFLDLASDEDEGSEVSDLRREIRHKDKTRACDRQYAGVLTEARRCFQAFSQGAPAKSLLFGAEGGRASVDFSAAVDAEDGRIYVLQPENSGEDALFAKAVKGAFFEAVLNSPARRERGADMPLVLYVADEFHRFVTSDSDHGEQSFFDRARSFGCGAVVATQGVSGLIHSLNIAREPSVGTAVKMLLTNTGSKLFFRTTEHETRGLLDSIGPGAGPNRVTTLRPPSTLRPGECYASLPDGRFERRQLKQLDLSGVAR